MWRNLAGAIVGLLTVVASWLALLFLTELTVPDDYVAVLVSIFPPDIAFTRTFVAIVHGALLVSGVLGGMVSSRIANTRAGLHLLTAFVILLGVLGATSGDGEPMSFALGTLVAVAGVIVGGRLGNRR